MIDYVIFHFGTVHFGNYRILLCLNDSFYLSDNRGCYANTVNPHQDIGDYIWMEFIRRKIGVTNTSMQCE